MMAKRFKIRIFKVIPSFQSCRSKDPSTLPLDPAASTLVSLHVAPRSPPKNHGCSLRRHVASAFVSVGCGFRSKPTLSDEDGAESPPEQFKWEEEDKWHVVAKVYDDRTPSPKSYNFGVSDGDGLPPPPPPPTAEKRKRRARKKKRRMIPARLRISTSSAESVLFSSESFGEMEEDEETETLISSSRSFSTDSSPEPNPQLKTIRENHGIESHARRNSRNKKTNKKSRKPSRGVNSPSSPEMSESPARLSMFQRLIPCTVEGKVRESFAVVKKSEDPYGDFRRSMMEMIMEKQMFDAKELEQLLHCFLSLNARQYHGVIVEAFTEIWEALFCRRSISRPESRASCGSL